MDFEVPRVANDYDVMNAEDSEGEAMTQPIPSGGLISSHC